MELNGCVFVIERGELTQWKGSGKPDAVVHDSTTSLIQEGVLFDTAGPELRQHLESLPMVKKNKKLARCHTGEALCTPGFNLGVDFIIHAISPLFGSMPADKAESYLRQAYEQTLSIAKDHAVSHIAFPALSCAQKFPVTKAATIAMEECKAACSEFKEIHFLLADDSTVTLWKSLAAEIFKDKPEGARVDQVARKKLKGACDDNDLKNEVDDTSKSREKKPEGRADSKVKNKVDGTSNSREKKPQGLLYLYTEIRAEYIVPSKKLDLTVEVFLFDADFCKEREAYFKRCGIPESLLTKPMVRPDGYLTKKVSELIRADGYVIFEPLSTPALASEKDLLKNQALRYQQLLKDDPVVEIDNYTEMLEQEKLKKSDLARMFRSLQESNMKHNAEILELKSEVKGLNSEVKGLNSEVKGLNSEVKVLKSEAEANVARIESLEHEVDRLNGMDAILMRKMMETCRKLAKQVLIGAGIPLTGNWNDNVDDPAVITALSAAGLPQEALKLTKYGRGTLTASAHEVTEPPEDYRSMINKHFAGDARVMDLYNFVFSP